ncbi:uncharacterized protein LOC143591624 [Bidens hawaiensis]|uniref:uncharacterized protein LOC143591624 n=1 Tax=Bidens hawaiensis TaxID=980011 RepID=UPI00404BA0A2
MSPLFPPGLLQKGMDIVGPFPNALDEVKFLLVEVDYFTKCPLVKPLASITRRQEFAEKPLSQWCNELQIKQVYSSVAYPQSNEQVERMNRDIVEEKTSLGKTSYSLVFGSKVVIPAEIGVNSRRVRSIKQEAYASEVFLNLDLLEEARSQASIRKARYNKKLEAFYDTRVRMEIFKPRYLVLKNNEASKESDTGKKRTKWEGPYIISEAHWVGYYKLNDLKGKKVPHLWSDKHLKRFLV